MIEVTAFNWTYWVKASLWFVVFFAGIIIPAQVYSAFKNDRSIAHKKTIIVFFVVAFIHFSYFYIKLPNLIAEFDDNKITLSGKLCGFKGTTEWYIICIDGKIFTHIRRLEICLMIPFLISLGWISQKDV
jgi:hypothetical protein